MTDRIEAAIKTIAPRFESANRCPVQKATVPIEEWRELLYSIAAATPAPAQLEDASTDKYCAECRKTKGADPAKGAQEDERSIIDTYKKLHEGKLGAHWLWVVIEQIAAGVPEDEAMRGFGYYERAAAPAEGAAQDAARYRRFFEAGLPITFMGVEYEDKASLDAAIDADLAQEGKP